ncbi:TrmH family RNA methyltransferase [Boudabousia marimammalium]|uniref:RNA 2-O ribose methyltransferase substrate binding domain-containing protein n=1 Tax=Boudabousia marimammalium TaxID=156892 RepID=A0A1Q5PNR9_9ACTO|nr:RNA methyltransferase [Boudabousia marimammalium]OKL49228.1 hypothetical protein BM477_04350 [Boudabousia marimammalium]
MTTSLFSERVDLLDNPTAGRVSFVAHLSNRKARSKYEQLLVEGPQAVRELVRFAPAAVRDVYVDVELVKHHHDLLVEARKITDFVHPCTRQVVNAMSSDAQGICAVANLEQLPIVSAEQFAAPSNELIMVLARIQDPGNAGTMIRVADAFGAQAVYATSGTVDMTSPKVVRASAGSAFHLPIVTGQFSDLVSALRRDGYQVFGTAVQATLTLDELLASRSQSLQGPVALVFGNEARGLAEDERELCDELLSIPMYGEAESLNVATAAAVITSAVARVRHQS